MVKITITLFKDKKLTERGFGALIESDLGDTTVVTYPTHSLDSFLWHLTDQIKMIVRKHRDVELFKELEEDSTEK